MIVLDDLCLNIVDCLHKTAPINELGNYFAVGTPAMRGNSIDYSLARRIDDITFDEWTKRLRPRYGDLLLAREAPVGPVVRIPIEENVAPGQRTVLLRPDTAKVISDYLYYLLIAPEQQERLNQPVGGSTVAHLNVADVRSFRLPDVPSLMEQRRIAGVLGALDDKIESNRKICSLINLLSEELFCSRFRLRKDCTTKRILTIGDLGEIVGGGTPSKKVEEYYVDSGIAWLTPKDLARDSSTFRHHGAIDISELGLRKSSARLLPRGTVLFTSRAPIGYIAIASGETSTNQGFKSIVPHPEFGTAFTFYLLKQLTPEIVSSANGSTFKEISKSGLASISFDAPDRASVREFNSLVQPLLDLQEARESETCRLSKLRDALLPDLMSGRMRVDEAGRLVSEALDEEVADV